ncbi:MAG: DMT family transporter [Bacteroidia bacterium]|nr:DMT family transporter [Bacteroidia bacterium]MCC7533509.1 DMT family transporter [Bacteroidia bacterium]MCZ2140283.1 DMT family transporter [Bacteroidia bacterium]
MQAKKLLQLHIIVLLWGLTPILGKLISFGALDLVWYRLVISLLGLGVFMYFKKQNFTLGIRPIIHIALIGVVVGMHWYLFYHAIKISNVSVTMAGFSTITLFASIFQPLLLKKKFFWGDFIYGLFLVVGLGVIFKFETNHLLGLVYGILAAITAAFFGIYNGKFIKDYGAYKITFYEFIGALIFISIYKLFFDDAGFVIPSVGFSDAFYLLMLSLVCTVVAFTWSINILKYFSPLTVIITNNLEPVYGILFSILLFGNDEYMSFGFYVGAVIILLSVFTYPFIKQKFTHET